MIRRAVIMHVHPDQHEEYAERQAAMGDDLRQAIKEHGGSNYSIYMDEEQSLLFAYIEVEDEERWKQIVETEACQRWWAHMSDVMPSNPDNSPVSGVASDTRRESTSRWAESGAATYHPNIGW